MRPSHSKLSVAMAVYNGERYMRAQLDSLAAQARLPDELVICDDASTDSSMDIARDFAAGASFPVHIHRNDENRGSTATFERAIEQCSGDIISLCDFDDVWYPRKLELTERALLDSPEAGIVACDADLVDEELRPLGSKLWRAVGFDARQRKIIVQGNAFPVLLRVCPPLGTQAAFKAKFKSLVLPMPEEGYFRTKGHDGWIGMLITSRGAGMALLEEPLFAYRQHSRQYSGGVLWATRLQDRIRTALRVRRNFDTVLDEAVLARLRCETQPEARRAVALLEAKLQHFSVRHNLPVGRLARIPVVTRELIRGDYHRYSHGFTSVAKDLVFS